MHQIFLNAHFYAKQKINLTGPDIKLFANGKFQTSGYRKPTFSGVLINFESFLPYYTKHNLVSFLLRCGFMICSSCRTLHFEIVKLKQISWSNRSPPLPPPPKKNVDCCWLLHINVFRYLLNIQIFALCQNWAAEFKQANKQTAT